MPASGGNLFRVCLRLFDGMEMFACTGQRQRECWQATYRRPILTMHRSFSSIENRNMTKSNNNDALKRINNDYQEFIRGVERCETEEFDPANVKDAIMRFSRLRERYLSEKTNLNTAACKALSKVFEEDKFVAGMMDLRQVTEHVKKRDGVELVTEGNVPILLDADTSVGAVFYGPIVYLTRADGEQEKIDHLKRLLELKKRVSKAIDNTMVVR